MAGNPGDGAIDKQARHQAGRKMIEHADAEEEVDEGTKLFATDRRTNEEAELAARASRDPDWRKGGGGGSRAPTAPVLAAEPGMALGLLAFGPPPPPAAKGLRVLEEPNPWVTL